LEKDRQKRKEKKLKKQGGADQEEMDGEGDLDEAEAEAPAPTDRGANKAKQSASSSKAADPWAGFEQGFEGAKRLICVISEASLAHQLSSGPKQQKKNRRKKRDRDEITPNDSKAQKELELLVDGDERSDDEETDDQRHARQRKIVADPRFQALVVDPRFNIDPTHNGANKKGKNKGKGHDQKIIIQARQAARAKVTDIDGPVHKARNSH